jgi:peptidoglycan/LPS O-acetylase OafA/YrhL
MLAWLGRRHPANWLGILLLAVCGRAVLSRFSDHMSLFGSYTILGRIDQFLLGMLAWHVRGWFKQRHIVCGLAALAYSVYVYELDHLGVPWGPRFRNDNWWIWLPTVEGLFFAMTVAWYDSSFEGRRISLPGRVAIMAGRTSYSMYLLHFFWVFAAARWFNAHVWPMSSPERGIVMASIAFLASMPIAMLSYRFIELPCLRARQSYQAEAPSGEGALPHDQPRVPEMPGAKVRRAS